jgi:hypothetical protein
MSTKNQTKKGGLQARLNELKAGVAKNFTATTKLMAGGTTYTQTSLEAKIDQMLAPYADLASARSKLQSARTEVKASAVGSRQTVDTVEAALKGMYGTTNPVLLDFGIGLPQPRPQLTAAQHVARAAKAAETRKLRNTMGPKQKAAIKSNSTIEVTAAPVQPAPPPAPAEVAGPPAAQAAPAPTANAPEPTPASAGGSAAK